MALQNLADFNIEPSSNYDRKTNILTISINNIGNVASTGWDSKDYRCMFEVTSDPLLSEDIKEYTKATPIYVYQNETVYTYYLIKRYNIDDNITNINIESIGNKYSIQTQDSSNVYFITSPVHEPDDIITITLNMVIDETNAGKTFMFSADDLPYYSTQEGDTPEIIDDYANPSNNYFVWTTPTLDDIIGEICLVEGTQVLTDQGYIAIEKIDVTKHTIDKQHIVTITKTVNTSPYLICVKESALGENVPSQDTIMSKDHMVSYKGGMLNANRLEHAETNVCKVDNTKTILYNVLLESYSKMIVNNMEVDTLHPENMVAKMSLFNWSSPAQKREFVNEYNVTDGSHTAEYYLLCQQIKEQ